MRRSRLTKNFEKKSRKRYCLVLSDIIVLFLLFRFGIDILVNFSTFISGSKTTAGTTNNNQISFIPPPILNPLVEATNSAQIIITGKSSKRSNH